MGPFALLVHTANNVAMDNIEVARTAFQALQQKAKHLQNWRVVALNDIYRFTVSVFFHLGEEIDPILPENLLYCSGGSRIYALYAQSYAPYLQRE
jgi:hypothetical protein